MSRLTEISILPPSKCQDYTEALGSASGVVGEGKVKIKDEVKNPTLTEKRVRMGHPNGLLRNYV
jgi:hypothetical protein